MSAPDGKWTVAVELKGQWRMFDDLKKALAVAMEMAREVKSLGHPVDVALVPNTWNGDPATIPGR